MSGRRKAEAPHKPARKSDAALIKAERDLADAWRRAERAGKVTGNIPGKAADLAYQIEDLINETPCNTLAGAAVKLRLLVDGLGSGWSKRDAPLLRDALAVVERAVKAGAA